MRSTRGFPWVCVELPPARQLRVSVSSHLLPQLHLRPAFLPALRLTTSTRAMSFCFPRFARVRALTRLPPPPRGGGVLYGCLLPLISARPVCPSRFSPAVRRIIPMLRTSGHHPPSAAQKIDTRPLLPFPPFLPTRLSFLLLAFFVYPESAHPPFKFFTGAPLATQLFAANPDYSSGGTFRFAGRSEALP